MTTAYHPATNGLVERFHRQLKASLMSITTSTRWVEALPMVLLGIHTSVKEDLGCCTAELVYGTTLRIPGQFFDPVEEIPDPLSFVQDSVPPCSRYKPNNPDTTPTGSLTSILSYTSALMSLSAEMQFAVPSNLHTMDPSRFTVGIPNSSLSLGQLANHRPSPWTD